MYIPTQAPPHLRDHDELRRWVEEELRRLGSAWAEMETKLNAATEVIESVNSAWVAYTPTVTITGGAGTAVGGYQRLGKTVFLWVRVTITSSGSDCSVSTPGGLVPVTTGRYFLAGRENNVTGFFYYAMIASTPSMYVVRYDGTVAATAGHVIHLSGLYEAV